ncbi:hypothetical protein [Demequina mangrovi]|uniref:Uncharacterized protein n=1 Tax=Demequina mangrovi TaxID=1043493 RepID=A0A1H6X0W1_9MICO|nr:hypothetical protein [Demequina mangrovi]SEJ21194.1 hypothetical protein SAMN05421637_1170 [Demequina mangrovi]
MRWELLFADLEASLDAADRADLDVEIAERTRDERATVPLAGRLLAHPGVAVRLVLHDGAAIEGAVADAAGAWVLLDGAPGQVLVPLAAVSSCEGLGHGATEVGAVRLRMGVGTVLREIAERGDAVSVQTPGGRWHGRVAAVGADHLELASERGMRTVPLAAVLAVRAG